MLNELESIHFLVGQEQALLRRLQDVGQTLSHEGFEWPAHFLSISNGEIIDISVGPNHVAFMLQDGSIVRTALTVTQNGQDITGRAESKPNKSCGAAPQIVDRSGGGASRQKMIRRSYQMMRAGGRAGRGVIVGTRPILPASAIPEDLIAQAQVVLQGKSREVIVRELQRTGLDVNQAVNNLLSRDEEDDDGSDSYLPEELISLLHEHGAGEHASVMLGSEADAALYAGSEAFLDYAVSHRRRVLERERATDKSERPQAPLLPNKSNPAIPGNSVQVWNDPEGHALKFDCMTSLYSELVAVESSTGLLYSWAWDEPCPSVPLPIHPKAFSLGLPTLPSQDKHIRVVQLQSSLSRCTLLTNEGQVASFVDISLGKEVSEVHDSPLVDLPERPSHIYTSNLFSAARASGSNALYWWGVVPFRLRKKQWEKAKSKQRKQVTFDTSEVSVGSEVRMRANPVYHAGAIGFTMINGTPQVGVLMESAWTLTETCRFRIQCEKDLKRQFVKPLIETISESKSESAAGKAIVADAPIRSVSLTPQSRKRSAPADEPAFKEEAWSLRDVTFINEGKAHENGKVVLVDGAYCGVVFAGAGGVPEEASAVMQATRLMRKDELQVVASQNLPRSPLALQKTPKSLTLPITGNIIDLVLDSHGVRSLVARSGKLCLIRCSLGGKVDSDHWLPVNLTAFYGVNNSQPKIINYGDDHALTVLDGNGCIMPMVRDGTNTFRHPASLLLPPVSSISIGLHPVKNETGPSNSSKSNRVLVHVVTLKNSTLMQHILHCDVDSVKMFLTKLEEEKNLDKAQEEIVNARIDGNRTILHAIVAACLAPTNKLNQDSPNDNNDNQATSTSNLYESRWQELLSGRSPRRGTPFSVRNLMQLTGMSVSGRGNELQSANIDNAQAGEATANWQANEKRNEHVNKPNEHTESTDPPRDDEMLSDIPLPPLPPSPRCVSESKERQKCALEILKYLCDHPFMTAYLLELLAIKDMSGETVFMYAVSTRCYSAALVLWETCRRLAAATSVEGEGMGNMIYPSGCASDDNPLLVLCYNDTCSFTWTGSEHINQDIFECKTCNLTGSLCCCTECAFVCHKNHDCKLKKTSPTAYCDCWERCKCQALVAGNQAVRFDLFNRLLTTTNLVHSVNSKGEHVLLFLARTVGRQAIEQRQYRPGRPKTSKPSDIQGELEVPEHDLDPPKFAKRAMELLLSSWSAVKSLINLSVRPLNDDMVLDEDHFYLLGQSSVSSLDRFSTCLVGRCAQDMLDLLLTTLISEVVKQGGDPDAENVVRRFVRSLIRVFLTFSVCSTGNSRRKSSNQPSLKCRRALQALITYSLPELATAADALFAPVRMGLAKPTQSFTMMNTNYDVVDTVEKLFAGESLSRVGASAASVNVPQTSVRAPPPIQSRDTVSHVPPRSTDTTAPSSAPLGGGSDGESDSDSDGGYSTSGVVGGRASVPTVANSIPPDTPTATDEANRTLDVFEESSVDPDATGEVYYSDGESGESVSHGDQEETMDNEDEHDTSADVDMLDQEDEDESDENATREFSASESGSDRDNEESNNDNMVEAINEDDNSNSSINNANANHSQVGNDQTSRTSAVQVNTSSAALSRAGEALAISRAPAVLTWGGAEGATPRRVEPPVIPPTGPTIPNTSSSATVPAPERGGFIFLDTSVPPPSNVRRGPPPVPSTAIPPGYVLPTSHAPESHPPPNNNTINKTLEPCEVPSSLTTSSLLARNFSTIIRQIVDLLSMLYNYKMMAPSLSKVLVVSTEDAIRIQNCVEDRMKGTWNWLITVLDSLEAQLKFSASLGSVLDPKMTLVPTSTTPSSRHRTGPPTSSGRSGVSSMPSLSNGSGRSMSSNVLDMLTAPSLAALGLDSRRARLMFVASEPVESGAQVAARKDFVTYLHSLLRSHSGEHADNFPVVDMSCLRHVVIVADALLSLVDMCSKISPDKQVHNDTEDLSQDSLSSRWEASSDVLDQIPEKNDEQMMNKFFRRSRSMIYPGICAHENAFSHTAHESLPLCDRPQLLTPDAPKERLFGLQSKAIPVREHIGRFQESGHAAPTHMSLATAETQKTLNVQEAMDTESRIGRAQSVIVHASQAEHNKPPPSLVRALRDMAGLPPLKEGSDNKNELSSVNQTLMGRWKVCLTVLAKAFSEELTNEPGSVLIQLAGFPILEQRFRREMEKYRIQHTKDLVLEVERDRPLLIQQTVKQLNQAFSRRQASSNGPPLAVHKVKVTFKDEPGEGSGVARSFYAAIAEAFAMQDKMPHLEQCQVGNQTTTICHNSKMQQSLLNRLRTKERLREVRRRSGALGPGAGAGRRYQLSVDAPPFFMRDESLPSSLSASAGTAVLNWDPSKQTLGERIYPRVRNLRPSMASKITGMLLELPPQQLVVLLTHEEILRMHVEDAYDIIISSQGRGGGGDGEEEVVDPYNIDPRNMSPSKAKKSISTPNLTATGVSKEVILDPEQIDDSAPLFIQPGKTGFFAPFPGKLSECRLNAFRNVGRMMGLCLLQNELFPLSLCRHVFKFILGRSINWFDLAFVDTTLFESLRSLAKGENIDFADLGLNFSIDLTAEEGGMTVELRPGGGDIAVTENNVIEYIYRYVQYRLKRSAEKPMQAMRSGVLDVIGQHYLDGLSAEDLRLLLCGSEQVSDRLLKALTTFSDESSASADQIATFKKWFWAVVDKMNPTEKQELVYFWTGSPSLPASEEGLQPLPTVLIRPADDHHLPTANTCISRLYVPLYSSKHILKHKLLIAIKAKNFGFV